MNGRRIAVVTGSARGIGQAIAEALAARGHDVIGVDRLEHGPGPWIKTVQVDLSDPDAPQRLIGELGRADILVNNAAILIRRPIGELSVQEFDSLVAVNLRAPFLLSQLAVASMAERGWGRIVNIASIAARTGGVLDASIYAATKAGLVALNKAFAREYGPRGVTVNAVLPGAIDTPMIAGLSDDTRERYIAEIPLRRFGQPSEVAAVVAFLASDEASFMTGATIDVNGGWVMA